MNSKQLIILKMMLEEIEKIDSPELRMRFLSLIEMLQEHNNG